MQPEASTSDFAGFVFKFLVPIIVGVVGAFIGTIFAYLANEHRERRTRLRTFIGEVNRLQAHIFLFPRTGSGATAIKYVESIRTQLIDQTCRTIPDIADDRKQDFEKWRDEIMFFSFSDFYINSYDLPLSAQGVNNLEKEVLKLIEITKKLSAAAKVTPLCWFDQVHLPES